MAIPNNEPASSGSLIRDRRLPVPKPGESAVGLALAKDRPSVAETEQRPSPLPTQQVSPAMWGVRAVSLIGGLALAGVVLVARQGGFAPADPANDTQGRAGPVAPAAVVAHSGDVGGVRSLSNQDIVDHALAAAQSQPTVASSETHLAPPEQAATTGDEFIVNASAKPPVEVATKALAHVVASNAATGSESGVESNLTTDLMPLPDEVVLGSLTLQTLDGRELKVSLQDTAVPVDLFRDDEEYVQANRFVAARQRGTSPTASFGMNGRKLEQLRQSLVRARVAAQQDPSKQPIVAKIEAQISAMEEEFQRIQRRPGAQPLRQFIRQRDDLAGLPFEFGPDCQLDESEGKSLHEMSRMLVGTASRLQLPRGDCDVSTGSSPTKRLVESSLRQSRQLDNPDQALHTIDQILQIDYPSMRIELIDSLKRQPSEASLQRIADRAKYDLVPQVRKHAIEALKRFPVEEVRPHLVAGLQYPWPVVAMHSAEALVGLGDEGAVPQLREMLELPDPRLPFLDERQQIVARELVSINHMRNCLLCHAPSESPLDYGRAATPLVSEPPPQQYYQSRSPDQGFVRADMTYLRQDFSVQQKVEYPGPWPEVQRFDYVVRQRPIRGKERRNLEARLKSEPGVYQEAIQFALDRLDRGQQPQADTLVWQHVASGRP